MWKPIRDVAILTMLCGASLAHATWTRTKPQAPPQLIAQIQTTHRIFVANGGEDLEQSTDNDYSSSAYGSLYQALAAWPGVQLVDSPGRAELVFEVGTGEESTTSRVGRPTPKHLNDAYETTTYYSMWLRIYEPQYPKQLLWKDYDSATNYTDALQEMLQRLWATPMPTAAPVTVPFPLAMRAPQKLFLKWDNLGSVEKGNLYGRPSVYTLPLLQAVTQSLTGRYVWVDSADKADLVVSVSLNTSPDEKGNRPYDSFAVNLLDPATGVSMWNIATAFTFDKKGEVQITKTLPYFLKKWDVVFGKVKK